MTDDCLFCVYSDTDICENCYNNINNEDVINKDNITDSVSNK